MSRIPDRATATPAGTGAPAGASGGGDGMLALRFARAPDGDTFIDHQHARFPFHVCRVLRFEDDPPGMATIYLQSASGGLYDGDNLHMEIDVQDRAQVHVTSQAATLVHATRAGEASQHVRICAGPGAAVEHLPDAVILFPRARLRSTLRVTLCEDSTVIVGESFLSHDPLELGRVFTKLASDVSVEDPAGETLMRDRFVIHGDADLEPRPTRRPRFTAHGSMLCMGFDAQHEAILDAVRHALREQEMHFSDLYAGASTLPGGHGVWVRILAGDGASLKRAMHGCWASVRMTTAGRAPQVRRK